VTEHGADVAKRFIEMFRSAIATLFKDIDKIDEEILIKAFKSVNEILMKMELKNA
jgi:DNA-binding MarR family transcriptional regulator